MTGKFADGCVGQRDTAEFLQIFLGKSIRPQAATSGDETFQSVAVTCFQSKSYFDGKGVGLTVETVAVATTKGYVSVGRDYRFRFFVLVLRFFLQ
jgi:hypothetical protein